MNPHHVNTSHFDSRSQKLIISCKPTPLFAVNPGFGVMLCLHNVRGNPGLYINNESDTGASCLQIHFKVFKFLLFLLKQMLTNVI